MRLEIGGRDLVEAGIPAGPAIGRALSAMANMDDFINARTGSSLTAQALMDRLAPLFLRQGFVSFDPGEPERYRKDVPKAEVHVLDAGHFALDIKADEIAVLVKTFMK